MDEKDGLLESVVGFMECVVEEELANLVWTPWKYSRG